MPRFTQDFNQKFPINLEQARHISDEIPRTPSSRVEEKDGSPGNSIEMQNLSPRDASPLAKRPNYGSTGVNPQGARLNNPPVSSDKPEALEPFSIKEEFIAMLTFAIPLAIGVSARNMIYNIDTIYLGHIGVTQLAGASLAMNLTEMFGELYFSSCFTLTALTGQVCASLQLLHHLLYSGSHLCELNTWLSLLGPLRHLLPLHLNLFQFDSEKLNSDPV